MIGLITQGFGTTGTIRQVILDGLGASGGVAPPAAGTSLYVHKELGGGGSIDYQVPRAPRTLADSPEADAKRLAEIAALDSIYSTLTGPTASPRMQAEAEFLAEQFEDEDGEIDFGAWADDKQARDALNAVHGRYSEARKTMFNGLRERNYDWQE